MAHPERWYIGPGGRWVYDPDRTGPDPDVTGRMPAVRPVDELAALHGDERIMLPLRETHVPAQPEPAGDVGDWIDPNAPDPTGPEVTDRYDVNYVEPWRPE